MPSTFSLFLQGIYIFIANSTRAIMNTPPPNPTKSADPVIRYVWKINPDKGLYFCPEKFPGGTFYDYPRKNYTGNNETPYRKETPMLTATEIANLTDDELTALNKELTHKLGKKIAIQIAVRVGVALTVHYAASAIIKKLDSKQEQDSK